MITSISRSWTFDAGHQLPLHSGKCSFIHGHTYRLEVTVSGPLQTEGSETGMVLDFGNLNSFVRSHVVDRLDHSFMLGIHPIPIECRWYDPSTETLDDRAKILNQWGFGNVVPVPREMTTVELLASWIFEVLETGLKSSDWGKDLKISAVRLYETPTSWAEVVGE